MINTTTYDLLERFEEYITDKEAFYAILDYLPPSHQYHLIRKLLNKEYLLTPSDCRKGIATRGEIIIGKENITLYDNNNKRHTLLKLPQPYDI